MQADIISIGNELLIGQVVNTNAAWLGRELSGVGIEVTRTTAIPDDKAVISQTIRESMERVPWVFVTGGLGPTRDDMTKGALIDVFGGELVFSQQTWDHLVALMTRFGRTPQPSHRAQCYLPSTARVLPNAMGTAPGLLFDTPGCRVFVMPGVPFEMEHLMTGQVIPLIRASGETRNLVFRVIATVGEAESILSDRITEIEDSLPEGVSIAYLPSPARIRIRISGGDAETVEAVADRVAERVVDCVYAREDISLPEAIGRTLRSFGKTVAVAESCTGGFLGHLFTAVPHASDYFIGGAITYSNEMKMQVLGVRAETLEQHGAVSEETVREMATRARERFGADYAISISGIAGPSGGTEEKPVGTVWIAVADAQDVVAQKFTFGRDRLRNIEFSAIHALNMLRKRMKQSK